MWIRPGRKAVAIVFVASIAASGIVVLVPQLSVQAAAPTLTIPGRVYPEPGQILDFSGTDPISDDNRAIVVDGLEAGPLGCAPDAGNDYEIDDCPGVDLELSGEAGLLRMSGIEGINNDGDPENDLLFNADEGVVVTATDSQNGRDSRIFTLRGPEAGVLNMLTTLQLVPCSEQFGTDVVPAPPAGENPYTVDCGEPGGHPDDEPLYEERESEDGQLPNLFVRAIQGDASGNATGNIYFKFESANEGPDVSAPAGAIDAPAGATTDVDGQVDVVDDDMCNQLLCGAPYTENPGMAEGDDEMLLVAWIPEQDCGTFNFIVSAALTNLGGSARPSVHDVLRAWTGLDLNDGDQDLAADEIAAAVELNLSMEATDLDLSSQGAGVGTPTTVFAATGEIDEVRWALDNIDYNAPADDATCHVNIEVSDLGNNGKPLSYVGSPFGPETPYTGHTLPDDGDPGTPLEPGDDEPYEVPDALADATSLTFNVKDSHPEVDIDQDLPGAAGPSKPNGFTVTFSEAIETSSFVPLDDLTLTTSNAAVGAIGVVIPVTPGLVYFVPVTATGGDTTLTLEFTGTAYAAGHPNQAAFTVETPSSYADNEIDWDQTGPEVTINKKDGQPDPTNTEPIRFTVEFSDTLSSAPFGFDESDVMVTGATGVVVNDTGDLDPKTWEVVVTNVTGPGPVVATIPAGAIVDTALNGSQASTSTDNSVEFVSGRIVSIADASIAEGNSGTTNLTFTLTLDAAAAGNESVLVNTSVVPGGATAGVDYVSLVDLPVSFSTGAMSATVTVIVNGDLPFEQNEDFNVTLSAPQNATIGDGQAVGTILNDDQAIFAQITPSFLKEGDAGTSSMQFSVVLTQPAVGGESVMAVPTPGNASPADVVLVPQLVTFMPGDMFKLVGFDVIGDIEPELGEIFTVTLQSPVGLQILPGSAEGFIFNDDIEVSIAADTTIAEGAVGSVTLNISPQIHPSFIVRISTTDGTAISGVPDADFIHLTSQFVTVDANATSVTVPLTTIEDNDVELDETFTVTVAPPASQSPDFTIRTDPADDTRTVTIDDNDVPSVVSISDATVAEGGAANTIQLSMTNFTDRTCTALVTTSNGSATAPADFVALTDADFDIINAGTYFVPLTIEDDPDSEGPQFFTVSISLVPDLNCVLGGQTSATVLIADNELVDNTPPTPIVAADGAQDDPTNASPIVFDVDFGEPVTGFDASDVVLGTPPTGATLTPSVSGGPDVYQVSVAVSGATGTGSVQVSLDAGAATDAGGNASNASNQASVAFDPVSPTVQITGPAGPTNAPTFTVTFSEPVTDFQTGDVTLGGSANPATQDVIPVSQTVYTVHVSGMTADGNVTASIAAGVASDLAGNLNGASPADATAVFDGTAPTVTINRAAGQDDVTSEASIEFDVEFSEVVTDFLTGDVALAGTAGPGMTATVTGSGTSYTVSVTGMTLTGTVIASIPQGVAHDAAGNGNSLATFTDNNVQFNLPIETDKPTVTINQAVAQLDPTTGTSVTFTVVFSESVANFIASDVVIGGTAGATTASVSGSDANYTVTITGMTQAGTVTASIPAGAANDAASNTSEASTSGDNSVEFNQPVINVSTAGGTVAISVVTGGIVTAASGTAPQVPPPSGVTFPFGQLSFTASSTPGGLVTFRLVLPSAVTTYYKLVGGAWEDFVWNGETGVQVSGNTLTVTIRDNGRGDSDQTSGVVTDPGAPAVVAQVPPTTPTTPPTTPTTTPGALPPTGSSSQPIVLIAGLLVGLGLVLLATRRRQSRSARA